MKHLRPKSIFHALACPLVLVAWHLCAAEIPTEEIQVTDTRVKNLRADLVIAEDRMHAIFNNLVEDEFLIVCEDIAITGSLVKQRLCEPNFRRQAKIRDFRQAQDGGRDRIRYIRSSKSLDRDLEDKQRQMQALLEQLAGEHPDLLAALAEVLRLRNAILARGETP